MKVGLLTIQQKDELIGQMFAPDSYFNPTQDERGNWFISLIEMYQCVNPNYMWVKDLPLIDYQYAPPTMSGLKVEIPSYWEVFFPDDTFILNGFIVELERINGALAVDIAYLQWTNFQAELDKPINEAVKRHMMPIWDYVIEQINQNNFIQ